MNEIINNENLFLIILAFVWIIGAVIQDLRRREVDNIWNFSLIAFALAYRSAVSVYSGNYWFALNGVLGFLIFVFLGNVFYYSRLFAGGDAKLLIALGSILPLSYDWIINFKIFGVFILLSFFLGSVYVLLWSIFLAWLNFSRFKKEFLKQLKKYKSMFLWAFGFAVLWIIFSLFVGKSYFGLIALVVFLFPILFVFAKSVEESCMIDSLTPYQVTEGDWLYKDIRVGTKKIKASWDGVSKSELKLLREKFRKKILVKKGIPFTPGFLLGLIGLLFLAWKKGWIFGG